MRAQKKPFAFPKPQAPVVLSESAYFRLKCAYLEVQQEEQRLMGVLRDAVVKAGLDSACRYRLDDATLTATVVTR